jgi:hypothetical protein
MKRFLSVLLCCASVAAAQTTDTPRLADGRMDVAAVLSSFKAERPTGTNTKRNQFNGEMLGVTFSASYVETAPPDPFTLLIRASGLSEEIAYLAAVLLTDLICLDQNRGVAPLNWDASASVETGWQVISACSTSSRLPMPNDSRGP